MSATVAAALKKIAVSILTDKKALKTVGGIILGIIILICLPVVSIVSILNGDIQFDEARLQQIVVQNLSAEETDRLKAVENTMYAIDNAMTAAGFDKRSIITVGDKAYILTVRFVRVRESFAVCQLAYLVFCERSERKHKTTQPFTTQGIKNIALILCGVK